MTREGALIIIVAFTVLLIAIGVWAWTKRRRRDATPLITAGEAPTGSSTVAVFEGLYVATTRHDVPLERIAAPGLGMRSRVTITVTGAGLALDLTGRPRLFLTADRIAGVDQSTVAIDRVVEKDGLTRLAWRTDAGDVVDSYFRPQDASARALADAIAGILSTSQTGTDA